MQKRASQSQPLPARKISADLHAGLQKANSTEAKALARIDLDAKPAQRFPRLGHQPFSARLVDRRLRAVRHHNGKPFLSRSDSPRPAGPPPITHTSARCLT